MSFMGIDGDEIRTIKSDYRELEHRVKRVRAAGYPVTVRDRMGMLSHIKEQRMQQRLTDRLLQKDEALYILVEQRAACFERGDGPGHKISRESLTHIIVHQFCLISDDRFGASLDELAMNWREAQARSYVDFRY